MAISTSNAGSAAGSALRRGRRRPVDSTVKVLLVAAALVSVATTIGIVIALVQPTIGFFQQVSIVEFVTGTSWTPTFAQKAYGVLPLVAATLTVTGVALAIAVPLGLGSAIYLSEYANPRTRKVLKPIIELLAGVPTVVYGFVALFALNPLLQKWWPTDNGPAFQNLLIAGIAMGIMIVPTIASISEDSMAAVPRSLREGAYALASTKMQVSTRVVVPAAMSGIVAAVVLGISRAVGETMIVTIAGGLTSDRIVLNPLEGAATMTAFIANISSGDIPVGSLDYDSVFAVGALLFLITFALNAVSIRMVRRFREVYE
ncbi:phosphate ABC transporter permease subunit PstC [Salinispora tropica]|uniref:Phosphate transport system permease protein n=1 Tax=Salinispora tropica (strain ATCC BAA-916 / DSM 44818 / JCM 13857 / NBRC 105044 / CNB-440) TaxID=369723 RepID=A4X1M2_SALTO|nr:phosphate ABC transporter permease subunit PstC [Salinispora tropica]ABP52772.1 phosphate ABC transporter, inner membrane subunit PstC [Salinispora tropica CNB-440]